MNTIDSITEALVTAIASCFVLDFSGKHLVIREVWLNCALRSLCCILRSLGRSSFAHDNNNNNNNNNNKDNNNNNNNNNDNNNDDDDDDDYDDDDDDHEDDTYNISSIKRLTSK